MAKNTDIEGYYFDSDVTKAKMRGLAYFAEKFANADFELGKFHAMPVTAKGPRKPIFILSDVANDFITYCINEKLVDLRIDTDGINWGKITMGGNIAADASPYDLIMMLTYTLGNPAHWESRLIMAFQTGTLQQVLNRGEELAGGE